MTDLLETCASELERGVKSLFENAPWIPGSGLRETPVIGGHFMSYKQQLPLGLCERVCRALASRVQFDRDKPPWAPALPLHKDLIEKMAHADSVWLRFIGLFADSLKKSDWYYDRHPTFHTYCCGLVHYRATPDRLRTNAEILAEFPPRLLPGLCDGYLHWRTFEQISRDRKDLARAAVVEARMATAYSE
jgi:hypothetical protein